MSGSRRQTPRRPGAPTRAMPSSSSSAADLDASAAVLASGRLNGRGRPEDFASFLRTQRKVDALCDKYGVPVEFTARPAGKLQRANSTPPLGAICVHGRALEAGMGVPLHGFFREALAHFGIAPAQLTPNGWRVMTGFLALCRSHGVPPSLAVFRYFFMLCVVDRRHGRGWYCFRSRDGSRLRFTGMPNPSSASFKDWKRDFFFLSSPEPWLCPVEWGEPLRSSFGIPVLTGEEKKSAAKLLRAHGGAAVDLRTYLCDSNLAAAAMKTTAFSLLPSPPAPSSSSPEGMDPSVYHMMKTMLAEKAATAQASASVKKVKSKPGSRRGKKRSLKEASDKERPPPSVLNTAEANSELASAKREAEQEKAKAELAATRAELAKAEAGLAAAEAEVLKAKAELTAAKRAAGAEQGRPESAIEGPELQEAKAKLAAAKRALEEELESAKAAALHQLLCCEEHVRRRAEHALERYQQWRSGHAPAGCTAWLAC